MRSRCDFPVPRPDAGLTRKRMPDAAMSDPETSSENRGILSGSAMIRPMPKPQIQILVCLNERPPEGTKPSCAPRGSLAVYHRFKDRVKELGIRDHVMVVRTGCLKHCSQGITVAVWPYNLWYRGVTVG